MADVKEFAKDVKLSLGAIVFVGAFLISLTFSATTIYWRFGVVEQQIKEMEVLIEERMKIIENRVEYVDGRIDRKTGQLENKVDELKGKVESLH